MAAERGGSWTAVKRRTKGCQCIVEEKIRIRFWYVVVLMIRFLVVLMLGLLLLFVVRPLCVRASPLLLEDDGCWMGLWLPGCSENGFWARGVRCTTVDWAFARACDNFAFEKN